MKKWIVGILCLTVFWLAGCTAETPNGTEITVLEEPTVTQPTTEPVKETDPPETQPPETEPEETEPPAPETVSASVLADKTMVILTTVDRGETVEIAGEWEDYYIVKVEAGYGLIEKRLVRGENTEEYDQWSGYAYSGAKLYDTYHLIPDSYRELALNTKVLVLDVLGESCVVQVENAIGYMRLDQISKSYIQYNPGSGGADGGDISLEYGVGATPLSTFVAPPEEVFSGTVAVVLADRAEIVYGWYDRGESVERITEEGYLPEKEGFYTVYVAGICGYVRQNLIAQEDAEPYASWDGYAYSKAGVYDNYYLTGEPVQKLSLNTAVCVLEDLGFCYLISVGETTGYMDKGLISENKIVYSGGGAEWSDPVM